MTNLSELTMEQLRRAVEIKEQIEALQGELDALTGEAAPRRGRPPGRPRVGRPPGRRTMSAAARAAIAQAQRARWAKQKGEASAATQASGNGRRRKRRMSAAGRARIAAAAKKRWAAAKASGKNTL